MFSLHRKRLGNEKERNLPGFEAVLPLLEQTSPLKVAVPIDNMINQNANPFIIATKTQPFSQAKTL